MTRAPSLTPLLLLPWSQRHNLLVGTTTLGDVAAKCGAITVRCRNCGHAGTRDVRRLVVEYGRDAPLHRVKFACSQCGGTDIEVAP